PDNRSCDRRRFARLPPEPEIWPWRGPSPVDEECTGGGRAAGGMDGFFPTNREFAASIDSIDRRLFKRHPYGVIVEAVWLDAFQMVIRAVHQYRTMDLSRGGIRLLGRQMHYEGTIGVVILPRRDAPPTRYGVRVRNSVYNGAQM